MSQFEENEYTVEHDGGPTDAYYLIIDPTGEPICSKISLDDAHVVADHLNDPSNYGGYSIVDDAINQEGQWYVLRSPLDEDLFRTINRGELETLLSILNS